jgi:GTP-binding protein
MVASAEFITSAVHPSDYPPTNSPEIAFAGRSNVGKSSLINALTNRRHLVKTSATPGRTRLINFFAINSELVFVDLPGYGYANVPVAVRKSWKPMVETYLAIRHQLKGVVLIMDVRRTPGQEEQNLFVWFQRLALPCIAVLTKSDKLSRTRQLNQRTHIAGILGKNKDELILVSAKTRQGLPSLWQAISSLAAQSRPSSSGTVFNGS